MLSMTTERYTYYLKCCVFYIFIPLICLACYKVSRIF